MLGEMVHGVCFDMLQASSGVETRAQHSTAATVASAALSETWGVKTPS